MRAPETLVMRAICAGEGGGGESVTRLLGSEGAGLLHPEPGPL